MQGEENELETEGCLVSKNNQNFLFCSILLVVLT